jgi:hypothetical protein
MWKYGNVLLVHRQVIWKKLLVGTESYLSCFFLQNFYTAVSWWIYLTRIGSRSVTGVCIVYPACFLWSRLYCNIIDKVLIKLTQTSLPKYCCPNEDHF